jgi:glycosyltransferase involved in cell wall biosynthesis
MKALVIASRFPWPPYTGDRLAATIWIAALAPHGEVALIAPSGKVPDDARRFRFFPAQRSLWRRVQSVLTVLRDGLPFQCLMAGPYDWRAAMAQARNEIGPFDVTVVILSRLHPWVAKSLEGRTVLDAVDSLRKSAEERQKEAAPWMRWFWRMEARRMARLERDAARAYGKVVVVSEAETKELDGAVAVPVGIAAKPLNYAPVKAPRAYDFGFWGRLAYFANADAASWLLDEIWPAIRVLNPSATLIIGGADAGRSLRNSARRRGITLISPIDDIGSFARNIRVALMPLRFGSGQSNKVLEAAEGGCAIVGTPQAFRGLAALASHARIESSTDGFARAAVDLLADDDLRARQASRLRDVVTAEYARSVTLDRLAAIAGVSEER